MRNTAVLAITLAAMYAPPRPTAFHVDVAGHGRPMILIPGLSSSGDTWKGTVAHYQNRFAIHTLTLAGFAGEPPIDTRPFLTAVRDQLVQYIEAQRLDKPIVVGHSLGGNVALDLASSRPELVGPLVVVDSLPFYAGVMFRVDSLEAAKPMIDGLRAQLSSLTREQYDEFVRSHKATQFMVTKPSDLDLLTAWGLKSDPGTVYAAMIESYTTDLRPSMRRITVPTLVLGTWIGIRDALKQSQTPVTKDAIVENFRQQYGDVARLHFAVSESARHFVMFDDPVWFYEQIDAFLANPAAVTTERGFTR